MKENYVQNLPVEDIERGCSDDFALFFYRLWKGTRGVMPDETSPIIDYLPKLVILKTVDNTSDSPDVIHVGRDSLFAQLLPQAADPHIHQPRHEIDPTYRALVRQSYLDASKGEPRYDMIGSAYRLPRGVEWLKVERLLLPFTAASGLRWIYCYSILRESQPIKGQPDQPDQRDCSPLPLNPDLLFLARLPT